MNMMTVSHPLSDREARLLAKDPRLNVALEASAGTGKTTVLVERYLSLVEFGADPRHILAITFTRKAAGEMRTRVIQELRKNAALWPEIKERLFDIHISTMDAFCLGLLREFPLEAGIDPDHELLDDVDVRRLAEEAVEDVLDDAARRESGSLGFLVTALGEGTLRRSLLDLLRNRLVKEELIRDFVRRHVPRGLTLEKVHRQMVAGLSDRLGGKAGVQELLASGPGPENLRFRAVAYAFERATCADRAGTLDIEVVCRYFLTEDEKRARTKLPPGFSKRDFRSQRDFERHRDLVLSLALEVEELYRRWRGDRDLYAVRELFSLYRAAARRFSQVKRTRGGLDFADTLRLAVRLLEERGEFALSRYRLEARYHHLLVDEFQDTNEAQWALVQALIDAWSEGAGLVQEAILAEQAKGRGRGLLTEPSIFIVGDRKQSIYGWRDARVEVLERAARHVLGVRPGGGRRLSIRESFRATPELLAFLNDVFSGVEKIGRYDWSFRYDEQDHFPVSPEVESKAPAVSIAMGRDLLEAASTVADEIVRLLEEESFSPSDVAILFRSRTHYRAYEDALAHRGVPSHVYRGLGFFDSPEVMDVRALVRFLAEPDSELRAAELLRSRFVGLTDTALALLAAAEESFVALLLGTLPKIELPLADRAAAERAAARAPAWILRADTVPPSDLIAQVLDETDYARCFAGQGGAQGWENLKKILEIVRKTENRGYLTLGRLASHLERASAGEESLAVLEAQNAVNLMTIHAAKGLEFRAVFLVNLSQKTRTDTHLPRIVETSEGYRVHALVSEPPGGPDRAIEEEKRLLYVALTRARQKLVLAATGPVERESRPTLLDLLPSSLRTLFTAARVGTEPELRWKPGEREYRLRVLRPSSAPRVLQRFEAAPPSRPALSPLATPRRALVLELARERAGVHADPWLFDPKDAAVGTTVHLLLENAVRVDDALVPAAERLLPELPGRLAGGRASAARLAAELYRELSSQPALKEVLSWGEIRREVPFTLAREGMILHGVVDAMVVGKERVAVIDFKTGVPRPDHDHQMALYLEAARLLFPDRIVEGRIFYPGRYPVTIITDGPRQAAQLRLF